MAAYAAAERVCTADEPHGLSEAFREYASENRQHGPAEGHRAAHCNDVTSPHWQHGYNLAYAGAWSGQR